MKDCKCGSLLSPERFDRVGQWLGDPKRRHLLLFCGILVPALLSLGMLNAHMETDVEKLWVQSGGRLDEERSFVANNVPVDPDESRAQQVLLTTAANEGDDVLTVDVLNDHMSVLEQLFLARVTVADTEWGITDVCHKVETAATANLGSLVPCTRISPLDCFREGGFDFPVSESLAKSLPILQTYGVYGYESLPSFRNASVDIKAELSGGCNGYARKVKAMEWPEQLLVGGAAHDAAGKLTKGEALETIILFSKDSTVAARNFLTPSQGAELTRKMRDVLLELPTKMRAAGNLTHTANYILVSDSLERMMQRVSSASGPLIVAGYAVMIVFVVFSLGRWNLAYVGLVGLLVVAIATVSSFGFTSILGVSFNATTTQVLPFLALGLGVDDMFVLSHMLAQVRRATLQARGRGENVSVTEEIGKTLRHAGPSVSVTSQANIAAFAVAAIIPLPAVRSFCLQACAVVAFNYLTLIITLPAAMAVLAKAKNPCGNRGEAAAVAGSPSRASVGVSVKYGNLLRSSAAKGVIMVLGVALLGSSLYGATLVDRGLELEDVAPAGSMEAEFLRVRFKYFSLFGGSLVTREMDYPAMQREILDLFDALHANKYVKAQSTTWLDDFIAFVNETSTLDANGLVPPHRFYPLLNKWSSDPQWSMAASLAGAEFFGISPETGKLSATITQFYVVDVEETEEFIELINSVRAVCDASPVPSFPTGIPFVFWEQYIFLQEFLLQGIGFSLAAVFVVTAIMLRSLPGAAIVCLLLLVTIVEVYGLLGLSEIKLSAIPAVALIMAIGIAVEFTAHLLLSFLNATGTRAERVSTALDDMFLAVLDGGLSTFFGIAVLAFSEFGFVRKYFFGIFCAVTVVGLFNGLAVLPVLLSLVGPKSRGSAGAAALPVADRGSLELTTQAVPGIAARAAAPPQQVSQPVATSATGDAVLTMTHSMQADSVAEDTTPEPARTS